MALSENNKSYLAEAVANGNAVVPAIVFANLKSLGLALKDESAPSAGRGRTTIVATPAGKAAIS